MSLPYFHILIIIFILVGFYKIGDLDDDIGALLGLAVGVLVAAACFFFPAGYLRIALYVVGGIAALTVYKMVRGGPRPGNPEDE